MPSNCPGDVGRGWGQAAEWVMKCGCGLRSCFILKAKKVVPAPPSTTGLVASEAAAAGTGGGSRKPREAVGWVSEVAENWIPPLCALTSSYGCRESLCPHPGEGMESSEVAAANGRSDSCLPLK